MLLTAGDTDAAAQHLRQSIDLFLTETPMFAPIPVSATICMPWVQAAYGQYLAMRAEDLDDTAYASLLRRDARTFSRDGRPSLMRIALAELQSTVGPEGLTSDDHRMLTMCSQDKQADITRLQGLLAEADDPAQRRELQMLLLGRYFSTGDPAAALEVAEALGEDAGGVVTAGARAERERTAANALYNVGVYHFQHREYQQARPLLERVIAEYPNSHFAEFARGYLSRIPIPEQDAQIDAGG